MSRFKMTIQYDGTLYHGWQVQNNAVSIQSTVQNAMQELCGRRLDITGCSRTDSGVHANEYCYHFDYDGTITDTAFPNALNTKLPQDISAVHCEKVADNFHARYSVQKKRYVYKFYTGKVRSPFLRSYAYHTKHSLDAELMNEAAQKFCGKYDFAAFCASGSSVENTERTVCSSYVERNGDIVSFYVEADGFLYNMVRIMAGTLLFVSQGKTGVDDIVGIIKSKNRDNAGPTVPPHGLYLDKVFY